MASQVRIITGVSVSPGLAIGPLQVVRSAAQNVVTWTVPADEVEREIERLRAALAAAAEELSRRQRVVGEQAGAKDAEIFAVHRMVLQDKTAVREVEATIRNERVNAEAAVHALIQRVQARLGKLEGDSVRSYAADLADPWEAVIAFLTRGEQREFLASQEKVVLAAAELTPQVVSSLERERVLGIITERGGRFSHGAVLARALGVPCVVGLPALLGRLERGMLAAVDGDRGTVQLAPGPEDIEGFLSRKSRVDARRQTLAEQAGEPAVTTDGHRLRVQVNIESLRDLDTFDPRHTDGIGLLRTEFLYMERPQFPSEDEQFRLYRRALERMGDIPVTLRTLDIGGDKQLPYFKTPRETNPALGWRGIRISLEWQDLLRVQLRAALRAGVGRKLRILLPMVSSLEEIQAVHAIFDGVRASLIEQGYEPEREVPVGMMVEVPSVLFVLPDLLPHVDFVSVGTNDLVQYLLAVDRDNPWVAKLYEPQHPAVIAALQRVAEVAAAHGKESCVCGDIASDAATALLLLGLGYDAVSVAPNFMPEVKFAVRQTSLDRARALAREALAQTTSSGVRSVLAEFRERLLST
jgi:phosphoenolpyruvate-protein phosphotransferase (PTS system enzyme I)